MQNPAVILTSSDIALLVVLALIFSAFAVMAVKDGRERRRGTRTGINSVPMGLLILGAFLLLIGLLNFAEEGSHREARAEMQELSRNDGVTVTETGDIETATYRTATQECTNAPVVVEANGVRRLELHNPMVECVPLRH